MPKKPVKPAVKRRKKKVAKKPSIFVEPSVVVKPAVVSTEAVVVKPAPLLEIAVHDPTVVERILAWLRGEDA